MPRVLHTVRGVGFVLRAHPLRRSLSLRTRVAIASALAATSVIVAIGIAFAVFLRVNGTEQLDRTLDSITLAIPTSSTLTPVQVPTNGGPAAPSIDGAAPTSSAADPVLIPTLPLSKAELAETSRTDTMRVRGVEVLGEPGTILALSVPEDPLSRAIRQQQMIVGAIAVAAVIVAGGLGWLLAGRAVRPLQRLAAATHTIGADPGAARPNVRGAREAEELAEAISHMLDRIGKAQRRTEEALGAARDFAAISAHELRTPLTSMRTDLEVLSTMYLTGAQRMEIHHDLLAAQRQVETTLSDLERLAIGELSDATDHEEIDLVELIDRCVQDSARTHRDLDIAFTAPESIVVRGIPPGLRLVLDNAIANSVRHGAARRVLVTVDQVIVGGNAEVVVTVDDDGLGVPEHERTSVFERFVRGAGSGPDGSGLGLALVAQQAELHGGSAALLDSPLGGARLMLRIPQPAAANEGTPTVTARRSVSKPHRV